MTFIVRHIVRSPFKSLLTFLTATFFIVATGWLSEAIYRAENEIDRLFSTTIVRAEIRQLNPFDEPPQNADIISYRLADYILASQYTQNVFAEAAFQYGLAPLLAFSDMQLFAQAHSRNIRDELPGGERILADNTPIGHFEVIFADGLTETDFTFTQGSPIPIILPHSSPQNLPLIRNLPTKKIGYHNRNITHHALQDAILLPQAALAYIFEDAVSYSTLTFEINPTHNREIAHVNYQLRRTVSRRDSGTVNLTLVLFDSELHNVVGAMERQITLLTMLYPVAIGISIAIAIGLSALLMLQNAKNAAIKRILGSTKLKTQITFSSEILILCIGGLLLGIIIVAIPNWNLPLPQSITLSALYLTGTILGATIAAILITNRPPLELLQVKE